ncbi:MAG: hypothetical protein QXE13_06615, partial [Sulfolobales archaeon]
MKLFIERTSSRIEEAFIGSHPECSLNSSKSSTLLLLARESRNDIRTASEIPRMLAMITIAGDENCSDERRYTAPRDAEKIPRINLKRLL